MIQKLKLAFLGGGVNSAIGRTHAVAAEMDGKFEVVAGCFSRNHAVNLESARAYGIPESNAYPSLQEMLDHSPKLDALVILTPTNQHFADLESCLVHDLPVICEKSLVGTTDEAKLVAERFRSRFLAVTYNYTGYPMLREARHLIRSGVLGNLCHVDALMPQEGFLKVSSGGAPLQPQSWRLQDGAIPTVYLDLGIHLHQIVAYLTDSRPLSVCGFQTTYGHFDGVVDYVCASAMYENQMHVNYCFGKSMLGHRNGLHLRVSGTKAALDWVQTNPEQLTLFHRDGRVEVMDRGCALAVANMSRYTRFKAGHPAGYVEAFANLYWDIHDALVDYQSTGIARSNEVFFGDFAASGVAFLDAMTRSASASTRLNI